MTGQTKTGPAWKLIMNASLEVDSLIRARKTQNLLLNETKPDERHGIEMRMLLYSRIIDQTNNYSHPTIIFSSVSAINLTCFSLAVKGIIHRREDIPRLIF